MPDAQTTFWLFTLLAMVFVWLVAWRPLFGLMAVCVLAPMTWLSMPVGPVNLHLYQAVLLATLVIAAC